MIRISFGYGLLFTKKLVHAGGLGLSLDYKSVFAQPELGIPRGHLYIVSDNSKLPFDFVCYQDPDHETDAYNNRFVSGSLDQYKKGIMKLQKETEVQKQKPRPVGVFAGP